MGWVSGLVRLFRIEAVSYERDCRLRTERIVLCADSLQRYQRAPYARTSHPDADP